MAIRPFDLIQNEGVKSVEAEPVVSLPDELQDALISAGLQAARPENLDRKAAREIFNNAGASVAEAAKSITNAMKFGKDATQLKAAELVLKVHEVMAEVEVNNVPQITINVTGKDSIVNLVLPL